ncbi:YIEGIA domain-containing protein [Selenihalanaerobacter shriftii]|uniref:YIEGIA protein n=1 Tax=Selenihalanaerobacter shriftii TaxID=142842 RepID=A0A1T4LWM5_9FIRM|nr:YIEGIA domain-containing protein [Selenihalanaerobacter shriftii]SJZ58878.1 hypothetical protein SAMN02745118_01270 [Selenihalanaerobacter shriftii]
MEHLSEIVIGILMGTIARIIMLKEDYRQYPSFPDAFLIHITIGFVAAALGAVALPALLENNFVAVTFLVLAIQQFRDVRKIEKNDLLALENVELVKRGEAYINGIAKSFEARNYIVIITSLVTTGTLEFMKTSYPILEIGLAVILGIMTPYLIDKWTKDQVVGDVAEVKKVTLKFDGHNLLVDGQYISNQALDNAKDRILEEGIGVVIKPYNHAGDISLANYGQRQAIAHEAARILGVKRYIETRRNFNTGEVIMMIVPMRKDVEALLKVIKQVPLLESTKREKHIQIGAD